MLAGMRECGVQRLARGVVPALCGKRSTHEPQGVCLIGRVAKRSKPPRRFARTHLGQHRIPCAQAHLGAPELGEQRE